MTTDFDATVDAWLAYQQSQRGRLRSALLTEGVLRHLPADPCDLLDVGGGMGELALICAGRGHRVTLADFSNAMLGHARARIAAAHVRTPVAIVQLDLSRDHALLAGPAFDVIICHNVLEYLPDPPAGLARLARALRPGGTLALAFGNAAHMPLQSAIVHRDLARAARELASGEAESSNMFGSQTRVLAYAALASELRALGLEIRAVYGVRCVSDLVDKSITDDPANYDALLALERALAPDPAHRLAARFVQLIAHKALP